MKTATSLPIELNESYLAATLVLLAIVGTAALVAWLPGSGWLRGGATIALGIYGIALERTSALRSARRAIVGFPLRPVLTVTLVDGSGAACEGVALGDSFVAAML